MDLEMYLILGAVLQVIILACFFSLCGNVGKIKTKFCRNDVPISTVIAILMATGQKEKAKIELTDFLIEKFSSYSSFEGGKSAVEEKIRPYRGLMDAVGLDFNADIACEIKAKL